MFYNKRVRNAGDNETNTPREIEPKLFEHPAIVVELLALYFEEYIP
jgi:hypothetical protein